MEILSEAEVRDALKPLQFDKSEGTARYLFRGQPSVYPEVTASIGRLSNEDLGHAYTILRIFVGQLRGQIRDAGGRPLDADKMIALLQHYGWPTPFLDLTDSPDVACFFAKHPAEDRTSKSPSVIYVLDRDKLPHRCRHVVHSDILDSMLNLRWTRQQGHALSANRWQDMDEVHIIDLLKISHVKSFYFHPETDATRDEIEFYLPPLDDVGKRLASLMRIVSVGLNFELGPRLSRCPF